MTDFPRVTYSHTGDSDQGWTFHVAGTISDDHASALTMAVEMGTVNLNDFVAVEDNEGTRIGYVSTLKLVRYPFNGAYVVAGITLH